MAEPTKLSPVSIIEDSAVIEGDANTSEILGSEWIQEMQEADRLPCDSFDAGQVRDKLKTVVGDPTFPHYQWGECESASVKAEEILYHELAEFEPEFTLVWGYGDQSLYQNIDGKPALAGYSFAGHAWVETRVCNNTFITDLIGGTKPGPSYGFALHYFSDANLLASTDDGPSPYLTHGLTTFTSTTPVHADDEAFLVTQKTAKSNMQTVAEYNGITPPLSTQFVNWLASWFE